MEGLLSVRRLTAQSIPITSQLKQGPWILPLSRPQNVSPEPPRVRPGCLEAGEDPVTEAEKLSVPGAEERETPGSLQSVSLPPTH